MDYYVNANQGVDQTGGGTALHPFKSFEYAIASINFSEDINIFLADGTYTIASTAFMNKLSTGMTLKIIGKGQKTTLKQSIRLNINVNAPDGKAGTNIYFCKLIYDFCNIVGANHNFASPNFWYENVVFINANSSPYGVIFPCNSVATINHCIQKSDSPNFCRCDSGTIHVNNSYGYFTSGYGTQNSQWNKSNNLIISRGTPLMLSDSYVITDPLSNSSIGLYGGNYGWIKLLLSVENEYFSILPEHYNAELMFYNKLDSFDFAESFPVDDLFIPVTIEGETFMPIEKFNNFQLVFKEHGDFDVMGLKSAKELIVASDDILCSVAQNIEFFKLLTKQSENGAIKVAISIDKGHTWNVYSNGTLLPLDITIPQKPFTDLADKEKTQYNNALDTILEQGIEPELFNKIDFNTLTETLNTIRFAYGISRPTFDVMAETDTLSWKYDAKGSMRLMNDSEFQVDVYGRNVKYTSFIENPLIKVNVMV